MSDGALLKLSSMGTEILCGPKAEKACLILFFNININYEIMAHRSLRSEKCIARGIRQVTTGLIGLWQPSAQSDVAF